jgi:hypothetical protein
VLAQRPKHFGKLWQIGKGAHEPTRMPQDKRTLGVLERLGLTTVGGSRLKGQHLDRLAGNVHVFNLLQEVGKQCLPVCHALLIASGKQQTGFRDRMSRRGLVNEGVLAKRLQWHCSGP